MNISVQNTKQKSLTFAFFRKRYIVNDLQVTSALPPRGRYDVVFCSLLFSHAGLERQSRSIV